MLAVLTQAPEATRVPLPAQPSAVVTDGDDWAGVRPPAAPAKERFVRTPPAEPERWSAGATKRFVGALLGGAVGAALPLVAGALATTACPPAAPCPGWGLVGGIAAPFLAVLGASLGTAVMGGEPSVGAALAGMIGGLALAAVLLLGDALLSFAPGTAPRWPIVVGASAAAVGLSVLAMESRNDALERAPFIAAPSSRLVLTSLALLGTLAVEALVFGLAISRLLGNGGVAAVLLVAALGTAPLVPIAVHRALGGRGSFGAGYLGWAASLAVTAIALVGATGTQASVFTSDPRLIGLFAISVVGGGLAAILGVPLFLEWSHGNALLEASNRPAVKAQLSVAPVAGPTGLSGGALALSGTF